MSFKAGKALSLSGTNFAGKSQADIAKLFTSTLDAGMHGVCMSPYEEGQEPGDTLTEAQIRSRLKILQPHTKWIRSFSCTEGNELVPKVARELGIKTMVGAWLGDDADNNANEIAGLIQLANDGLVDIAAVGNEVLYRGIWNKEEQLKYQ